MPITKNESFNPEFSKSPDIASLISAPLLALCKANAAMAQEQTRFMLDHCFKKSGNSYEPILIRMALNKSVMVPATPNGESPVHDNDKYTVENVTTYFDLPLLTIVPLNSLAVDKASIDFNIDITSHVVHPEGSAQESGNGITDEKVMLYGTIGHDNNDADSRDKSQQLSRVKVHLDAAALPLPLGVLSIIELYNKSIQIAPQENL